MASVAKRDRCFKVFHAEFQGHYGLSLHGTDGSRWFLAEDESLPTLLHPADMAALMECGQLDVIADQAQRDAAAGGMFGLVESHCTEHARVQAA